MDYVVSLLHHATTERINIENVDFVLNLDNCSGQNKNQFVLHYLAWRFIVQGACSFQLHFMIAGHTKCFNDQMFGLFKMLFSCCNCDVEAPDELNKCVRDIAVVEIF